MPSISMFDSVTFGSPKGRGNIMTVAGPLELDDPGAYEGPVAISFAVFQSPRGKHDIADAKRVRGTTHVDVLKKKGRWEGTVEVAPGTFHDGEARVIAVAVLPRKHMFAYETLTWCENFTLKGTGSKAPSTRPIAQ